MLAQPYTGDAPVSMLPCPDCSALVECKLGKGRAYSRRCEACAFAALRLKQRKSMATMRRKRGVPEVKGKVIACQGCGAEVVLNRSLKAKYCPSCSVVASRERAKVRVLKLARDRGAAEVGTQAACSRCNSQFTISAPRNHLCAPCGVMSVKMQHPDLRERQREYSKEWAATPNGRERTKAYQARSRTKRKASPAFTINERMSAGIRYSLASGKQGSSWQDLVSYALADLMAYLEAQFLPGMTWDNRGEWHIDHIRPLCSFNFQTPNDPQFREAWALSNLRPLWARDNLSKGGRWTPPT